MNRMKLIAAKRDREIQENSESAVDVLESEGAEETSAAE